MKKIKWDDKILKFKPDSINFLYCKFIKTTLLMDCYKKQKEKLNK